MSALGSLVVKLALEFAEYTKGLDKSSQEALKFGQNVQRNFDAAGRTAKEFFTGIATGALGAITAYAGVSATLARMNTSLAEMDKLDDLSQKLSINSTTLQEFAYAGKLSGVELDGMADGLKKLQINMAESITGGKAQEAVFKAMGIAVRDSSGNIRDTKSVMMDVANVFVGLEDGALKTSLAVKLFGKQGSDMVPFLNQGADGIRKLTEEAHKLGGVLSDETLKVAADFNDNLDRMRTLSHAAAAQMTGAFIPAINDVMLRFIEARKEATSFWEALGITSSMTFGKAIGDGYAKQLDDVNIRIKEAKALIEQNKNLPSWLTFGSKNEEDVAELERKRRAILNYQALRALEGGQGNGDRWDRHVKGFNDSANAKPDAKKIAASLLDSKKKEGGDDPAKKEMEGQLKFIELNLAKERDVRQFHSQYLSELRGQEILDIGSFDAYKKAAIDDELKSVISAYDKQIAVLEKYRNRAGIKDVDKADATNKIMERQSLKEKAIQDASQKTVLTILEEGRARSELRNQFVEYERAQAKSIELTQFELSLFGRSAIEIEKLREVKRSDLEIEEMRYQAKKRGTDLTEEEIRRATELRDKRLALIDKKEGIENDPWLNASESIRRYGEEAGKTGKQIGDAIANGMRSAEDAWVQFVMTGKMSFSDLARSVAADMVRMQARQGISEGGNWLGKLLGSFLGPYTSGASNYQGAAGIDGGGSVGGFYAMDAITASAAGGFDIPAGVNPVTQLHEREMVLPAEHADVIRGLAAGSSGVTVVNKVNVINNTPAQVTTRQTPDGGLEVLIDAIDNAIGERIGSGVGGTNAAMKGRYGLRESV